MNNSANQDKSACEAGADSLPDATCRELPFSAHLRLHLCAPQLLVFVGVLCVVALCAVGPVVAPSIQSYFEDGWHEKLAASENELAMLKTAAEHEKQRADALAGQLDQIGAEAKNEKKRADALRGQLDQIGAEAKKRTASINVSCSVTSAEVPAFGRAELKLKISKVGCDGPVLLMIESGNLGTYCVIPQTLVIAATEHEILLVVACNGSWVKESASGLLTITALADPELLCQCSIHVAYNSKAQKKK